MGHFIRTRHHVPAIVLDQIGTPDADEADREKEKADGKQHGRHGEVFEENAFHGVLTAFLSAFIRPSVFQRSQSPCLDIAVIR